MADDGPMSPHANAITGGADDPTHAKAYPPPARVSAGAYFPTLESYRTEYAASVADPAAWWAKKARETLDWFRPFSSGAAMGGSFAEGDVRWFADGQLNACYNCVSVRGALGLLNTDTTPFASRAFYLAPLSFSLAQVDRHVNAGRGDAPAIIYEADEIGAGRTLTFRDLLREVCRTASVMLLAGVRKGDTVAM